MKRRRTWLVLACVVVIVATAVVLVLPRILRESKTVRDQPIRLGSEQVHVKVVWTTWRSLLSTPHGDMIGGGHLYYDTTISYPTGRVIRLRTALQPRTIWIDGGRTYIACCDGGRWLIGEIRDGVIVPLPRAALPQPPPVWNLEPPGSDAEWNEDFSFWAK